MGPGGSGACLPSPYTSTKSGLSSSGSCPRISAGRIQSGIVFTSGAPSCFPKFCNSRHLLLDPLLIAAAIIWQAALCLSVVSLSAPDALHITVCFHVSHQGSPVLSLRQPYGQNLLTA